MRFFHQLLAVVLVTLLAVLGWDLSQRHIAGGNKQTIIYAGMFGPGEPMQVLYSGPSPQLEPEQPFGPDDEFRRLIFPKGLDYILSHACGLSEADDIDRRVIALIRPHFDRFREIRDSLAATKR